MLSQPWAADVVSCAIGVAGGIGARVVAEGVESLAQWETLEQAAQSHGIDVNNLVDELNKGD